MLELHVANAKVLPELLNSRSSSSTSIPFPSLAISFGCIETLGPMLDSKYDLKNDPSSYACKVFAEMPDKKIDMEVKHPVIIDSTNLASHIRTQLMGRSIFDYFKELGHANLPLSLYRFPPDHFGFSFSFDPGSSLLPELIRIFTCHMNSTSNAHCILPQFPFDPGANLFIICPGGCLQVFTLQPEASNWDLAICSMSMALIELTAKASYRYIAAATPYITKIRYFRNPTSDFFNDALVIALYHDILDVAGQIHREGSAQIHHGTNILDCIWNLSKLVVSINDAKNVDTPLVS
ncbi:hypothetical protein KY289_025714 [Solanum tuberosum]|nr:hypothetical protein KY289_025714 [Solanum tuberosum]